MVTKLYSLFTQLLESEFIELGTKDTGHSFTDTDDRYIIRQRYQPRTDQLRPMELEPWINIAEARSQAALACVQYLTLDCFTLYLSDEEVSNFVHKGYYCFQDYAVVYWYDHVELSLSEATSGDLFVDSLLSALNLLLTRNWHSPRATEQKEKDRRVPIKAVQRLKVLQDTRFPEVFRKLTVLASAPAPFEFLNFRIQVGRARAVLEGRHEPVFTTAQVQDLQKFYGHAFNHFKCRQESCAWFSQGFASVREVQKHEGLHDRSFRCPERTCPSAEIGFAMNAELQSHLTSQHPQKIVFHATEVSFNPDYDDTFIVEASGQGQLDIVKSLVQGGIDINTQDAEGMTALHRACLGGHDEVVRFLIWYDHIVLSGQDTNGTTPLIQAAAIGHDAIVRMLLERGHVGANAQDKDGWTALIWATMMGREAVVRLLLERGDVDADVQDKDGRTALIWAAISGYEAVVRLLLERGDVNASAQTKDGETALMRAAEGGYEAVVQLLLERGDVSAERALIRAAGGGHEAVVRLLLERDDVNVNAQTKDGETALMRAAWGGHEAVVQLLLEKGDVSAERALIRAAQGGHEAVVRLLLESDVGTNAQQMDGNTALMRAAGSGHESVVRLLLEKGDVSAERALIPAAGGGHEAVVRLLLESDVDANAQDTDGHTALMQAAGSGHEAAVRLLLERGDVKANAQTKGGGTALVRAAEGGHEAVVQLLLQRGSSPN